MTQFLRTNTAPKKSSWRNTRSLAQTQATKGKRQGSLTPGLIRYRAVAYTRQRMMKITIKQLELWQYGIRRNRTLSLQTPRQLRRRCNSTWGLSRSHKATLQNRNSLNHRIKKSSENTRRIPKRQGHYRFM